jgi:hypothetical protein
LNIKTNNQLTLYFRNGRECCNAFTAVMELATLRTADEETAASDSLAFILVLTLYKYIDNQKITKYMRDIQLVNHYTVIDLLID